MKKSKHKIKKTTSYLKLSTKKTKKPSQKGKK